ncbi:FAD-binding oxidoreductase [Tropicimonas sp. IMCC34011]|uniref:NAD(P)/FAD-dependent oxidoreductase n=1 Tax=Tropicimonas sp. IMCC34011 TaxID=2248759 RepID=UPI000E27D2C5|nr:FAD-binding oxidoreductase [Tropicimonas sp. IMCC34011]
MASIEATVRGAGIFGLACAFEMARRGARVRVIDTHGLAAGASGGVVGALAPHAPERWDAAKEAQLESLLAAPAFWAAVEGVSGRSPGYARLGRLQPIPEGGEDRAEARAAEAAERWRGQAEWRLIGVAEAGDWAPASPTGRLVFDTLSARIAPAAACAALAEAISRLGGEVILGEDAAEVGPVLHATGPAGLAALSEATGRVIGAAQKGQAARLGLDRRGLPQLYAGGLHIVPHADGSVAVGSTSERDFADPRSTDHQLDDVIAAARAACPALADAPVLERWAGLRPRSRSRRAIFGRFPGREGHFVANGGFKIGFGMAPLAARLMADLILDGRDAIPAPLRLEAMHVSRA